MNDDSVDDDSVADNSVNIHAAADNEYGDERRHQVVGAVFLVGLVLVIMPFAFDGTASNQSQAETQVEAQALPGRETQRMPLETDYTPPEVNAEQDLLALAEPLIQATDDAGFRTDTGARFGDPSFLPASDARATAWTAWGVQVGSFGDVENAREVRRLLRDAGHHVAFAEALIDGRRVTRVAVGPLLSREDAVRLQETLAKESGLEGVLVKFEN